MSRQRQTAEDVRGLAMGLHHGRQFQAAAEKWAQAAKLDPSHPETRNNLGVALQALGRLDDAADAFAEAVRLRGTYADAWENLTGVLLELGRREEAIATARQMVDQLPGSAASHIVLATALARAERYDDAAATCEAVRVDAANADVLYLLANVRAAQQRWSDAAAAYSKVIERAPSAVPAYVNLGVCLAATGQLQPAAARFREALARDSTCADAALRLADVLDRLGQRDEAFAAAKQAVQLQPDDAGALNLLASLMSRKGANGEAEKLYRRALEVDPRHAPALANYATLLARRGEIERAVPILRQAVTAEPSEPVAHSTLCMYLNADPSADARDVFEEHVRWAQKFSPKSPHPNSFPAYREGEKASERPRVGYVSPDWAGHPVARFMQPILESHDRDSFEIHIYDDAARPDAFTELLRPLVHHWHRVRGMPDAQLAEKIRAHGIDILVDLSGHTADNRLLVFARKPAPAQVSYLGYPNTTGLRAIDYRFTDAVADPLGLSDELHTERLIRLPGTFLTFRPPVETPSVVEPPVTNYGFVTFGSFNALWKINTPLLKLWSRILAAVPGSRLIMKADGLEDASVSARIRATFERAGVASGRVQLLGRERTYAGHLAAYGGCDLCLDTFPYAGTTTTCEALWMGVPVVTMTGKTHASRVGASLLTSIGLSDLITTKPDEAVAAACLFAKDVHRLRTLRLEMRDRLRCSPLMNPLALTRAIESAYRQMCS